ncbi:hypothetical protein [Georgenia sp. SUBG003]|uniref:hypothetical protein n=1 Tax=Georgenia sp. SUBG003 TaxID=1497974 RepID=UPI003AB73500
MAELRRRLPGPLRRGVRAPVARDDDVELARPGVGEQRTEAVRDDGLLVVGGATARSAPSSSVSAAAAFLAATRRSPARRVSARARSRRTPASR